MRLRELFEERKKKVVAVMPGGFHPFHPGHKSLYDWAVDTFGKPNVYVAATDDTKSRPFPFAIKQKLAAMAGVPTQRFIQVKSPFNALSYTGLLSDPENTALVFVRSEKDQTSHPKPDQIRKSDGQMGYIISYNGELEHGADMHGYMTYGPTIDFNFSGMDIKSASELRATWPEMDDESKAKAAELMYPGNGETASKLLNDALGDPEVPAESIEENITSADIPVVKYDRNYGGDVNKVLAVKRDAKADAEALYKKLGGVSDANYEIISKAAEQKKQELRQVYRDALAKQGIKGAAALKSPEYLLFRKQNADLKIMLGTAMNMAGNGSGKILKPTGKIIKEKDLDDVTLQRLLKFGAQIDMDKQTNPGEFIMVSDETKAAIAKARAQAKRDRVTDVPSRAHDKDGVHKQGFKPVKFPKSNSISNFKLADD